MKLLKHQQIPPLDSASQNSQMHKIMKKKAQEEILMILNWNLDVIFNEIFCYFVQLMDIFVNYRNSGAASNHCTSKQQGNNPGVIQPFK